MGQKYLNHLTKKQKERIPEWVEKWTQAGLKTGEADFDTFEKHIKVCYEKVNLECPKTIIRVSSPLVGAFAASFSELLLSNIHFSSVQKAAHVGVAVVHDAVHNTVHGAVDDAIHSAVQNTVAHAVVGAVHSDVSYAVRGAVGDAVRDAVHGAVGDAVRGAVHSAVGGAVHDAVRGAVGDAVYDAVRGTVHSAVGDAVYDEVRHAVDNAVRNTVSNTVDGTVLDAIHSAVKIFIRNTVKDKEILKKMKWHNWIGGQFWVGGRWGSPASVSFFIDVCKLVLDKDIFERYEAYRKVCESVNYVWLNKKFIIVCERPIRILRDKEGRLHSETQKAIEYSDGWGLYCLDGVTFPYDLWSKIVSGKMNISEIISITDADQRSIAFKYNKGSLLEEATLIHSSKRGNELYCIENREINKFLGFQKIWLLKMLCPTGRIFVEGVPPDEAEMYRDADMCQALLCKLSIEEYNNLRIES